LSYTTFEYSALADEVIDGQLVVSVNISNTGGIDGEEVAQLYISSPKAGDGHPLYSLKAIQRVELAAYESKQVDFALDSDAFDVVDDEGEAMLLKGDYNIFVCGSVPSERSEVLGAAKAVSSTVSSKIIKKL